MTRRVWGRRSAFNVQKVLWTLDELDLDYEHISVGGSFGGLDTPEFLAMNPHGRVPVLDDGVIIWESHAIVRYLCARYGAGTLWPVTPEARSFVDRWLDWSLATLQPAFMQLFWSFYRTPEPARDWTAIRDGLDRSAQCYALLDEHLRGSKYLAGDTFTMADIPAGTSLYRYFSLEIERPQLPNVSAWYARLAERSAFQRHVMVPFGELKGRTEF